nr:MAG TPA: hypothetical protein [Caudoviricetes sp.]
MFAKIINKRKSSYKKVNSPLIVDLSQYGKCRNQRLFCLGGNV